MTSVRRFLTKSRFKIGCECPSKLFYTDDKSYGSTMHDNAFLKALSEGGFQVGELAKTYFPGGIEIKERDHNAAAAATAELLKQQKVIIFEAAFLYENLFAKADIVRKNGDSIELIEVKAKSFDPAEENCFYTKSSVKKGSPQINSDWEKYILDVAFQTHVAKSAYPKLTIVPFLMLADKSAKTTVDGLNQKFYLEKADGSKTKVRVAPGTTKETVGAQILKKVDVSQEVAVANKLKFDDGSSFIQKISALAEVCASNSFLPSPLGTQCKGCEFRIAEQEIAKGLKSGFQHCWKQGRGLTDKDFKRPFVFDIWNFRKAPALLEENKVFMDQLVVEDINPKSDERGMSSSERQWLQVSKVKNKDTKSDLDLDGLNFEGQKWNYPLHFIDFETTMVAIPFNKGRRPYEQMAFQFSHHILREDGVIYHADEYINSDKGAFPNFEFVRRLMESLSKDEGTIFRYAAHENTVLCQIRQQLMAADNVADKEKLIKFIESITKSTVEGNEWEGSRNMVDMCELVKRYYYNPATGGSNSIKKVLPAVLKESKFLRRKYSAPIYGSHEIESKNFENWKWIELDSAGNVIDPYKRLPPIFSDLDLETMDSLITEGSIADGGAAMTAYARMQFTEMSEEECARVAKALLKYCELDTFAMVMIFEHWLNAENQLQEKVA